MGLSPIYINNMRESKKIMFRDKWLYIFTKHHAKHKLYKKYGPFRLYSPWTMYHEFKRVFKNSTVRWRRYFCFKYSTILEEILFILWHKQCINGYLKDWGKKKGSYILRIYLKTGYKQFNVRKQLFCYPWHSIVDCWHLEYLVWKKPWNVYIVSTSKGTMEGKDAVKQGLGGVLRYRVRL